jgi:hypothetical protein
MFDYIQYAYTSWNNNKKPQARKTVTPIISQDQLREQLRNTQERKPDGYKSSQSSAARFLTERNLDAN